MTTVEAVLDRHWAAFETQDLEGIMADYAEGSFIITNLGNFHGREEIEGLFVDLFEEFSQGEVGMNLDQQVVHEEYAYTCGMRKRPITSTSSPRTPS